VNEELTTGDVAEAVEEQTAKELEVPSPEQVANGTEAQPAAPVEALVEQEPVSPAAEQVEDDAVSALPGEALDEEEPVSSPAEQVEGDPESAVPADALDAEELVMTIETVDTEWIRLKAIIEAVIYITDEPLSLQQIASALGNPIDQVSKILEELTADYARPDRGLSIREVAGGYKLTTKPEHHEEIRVFVKNLKPPLKLSLAALETLAVIAYKQPITAPEIMEIRGVQGAGVLKTLLDRKLIATAGRKNVIGKPILYKTTREFLVQFGLKDLAELPTLKEFEELGRLALTDAEAEGGAPPPTPVSAQEPEPPVLDPEPPAEPPIEEPGPEQPPVTEPPPDEEQSDNVPERAEPAESHG
jgi:segregation and condensation protein B